MKTDPRLLKALQYIETHLGAPLTLDSIAASAHLSPFHFHRVFTNAIGMSAIAFVRARRLTMASDLLRDSDWALVDVALEVGFGSQAAFTRAFTGRFGVPPGAFRRLHLDLDIDRVDPIDAANLELLMSHMKQNPRIVHFKGATAIGLTGRFKSLDPGIGALWGQLMSQRDTQLGALPLGQRSFGVSMPDHRGQETFRYLAGIELANDAPPPEGFEIVSIEPGSYAVFTHEGPLSQLPQTIQLVWGDWVQNTSMTLRDAPDFELYDERFKGEAADSALDIYIPVEPPRA